MINGVTTSINWAGTASMGITEIDIADGNYSFVLNNISGTLKIYGFELLNTAYQLNYALNRGASDTGHWTNFAVAKRSFDYITSINPDLIIISLGFNDLNNPSIVLPNITSLINKLHQICSAEIVLSTSGNRCLSTSDHSPNTTILNNSNLLWPEYKEFADNDNKLTVFHLNPLMVDTAKWADYYLFVSDYVHTSTDGARMQADCIIDGIQV